MRQLFSLLWMVLCSTSVFGGAPPLDVRAALDAIRSRAAETHSDSVLIMQGDRVLLEEYSAAGSRFIETMSATKSVVALAIGALLTDGKISSLDVSVHAFFPEWKQGRKQAITLQMLLDHTSGLQNEPRPDVEIYPAPDAMKLALAAELSHEPGKRFAYNNKAVNLLAGIIEQASGIPMDRYVQQRLLAPLSAGMGEWYRDAAGNPHAMAGLSLDARGMAAIGRLVLDRGRWQGKQLVDPEFIDAMLAPSKRSKEVGLFWWRRVAWVRFRADAATFESLTRVDVRPALIDQLRILEGRTFDNEDALYAGLTEALGENWLQTWHQELTGPHGIGPWRPFHPEKGPVERFEANGSMGQYIVIVPKASLVGVRQIAASPGFDWQNDGYEDFSEQMQALADALVPSTAHHATTD